MEGATENIAEKLYGEKKSTKFPLRFNFSNEAAYNYQVSIIRQMEYALEMEADESILHGKMDFFNKFSQKYGKDVLRVIAHRANRLLPKVGILSQLKIKEDTVKYFKETQDIILHAIFDKEFEQINTIEDTQRYFTKLQGFETTRGKELWKEDLAFKTYYDEKLKLLHEKLAEKGYGENYTKFILEKHSYKKQEFYPFNNYANRLNEDFLDIYSKRFAIDGVSSALQDEKNIEEHLNDYQFYRGIYKQSNDEFIQYFVMTRVGTPIRVYHINSFEQAGYVPVLKKENGEYKFRDTQFSQTEDNFFMNVENTQIALEKFDVSLEPQEVRSTIEHIKESKEKRQRMKEQKTSLKAIAKTQRLSIINDIAARIKNAFLNKDRDRGQSYDMEEGQR